MEKKTAIFALTLLATAFIAASVFAYYPFQLVVQPISPPVIFIAGNNANQSDLRSGKQITVSVTENSTKATIEIHPTYQITYYKNLTLIKNTDERMYKIWLIIESIQSSLPSGSQVNLIIFDQNDNPIKEIPLSSSGSKVLIGQLNGNTYWRVDVKVYIPEGTDISSKSATFSMRVAYTPSDETPP